MFIVTSKKYKADYQASSQKNSLKFKTTKHNTTKILKTAADYLAISDY